MAAHDAETLEGENYDIHYPLSLAVTLLEQVADQVAGMKDQLEQLQAKRS